MQQFIDRAADLLDLLALAVDFFHKGLDVVLHLWNVNMCKPICMYVCMHTNEGDEKKMLQSGHDGTLFLMYIYNKD